MKKTLNPSDLELERLRLELLFQRNLIAQTSSIINAFIYIYLFKDIVSFTRIYLWVTAFLTVTVARMIFLLKFKKGTMVEISVGEIRLLEHSFTIGVFASGLLWGTAASIMLPYNSIVHDAFMGFLLAGMSAGVITAYSTSLKSIYAFLLPSILPFIIKLVITGSSLNYGMAGLLTIFILAFGRLALQTNRQTILSLKLRFEKNELLDKIKHTNAQAAQTSKLAALGEMAGGIAHEINTPLAIVSGYNQIIRGLIDTNKLSHETVSPLIESIDSTIIRIAKIISGLRFYSRDGKNDEFEIVDLKKLIENTLVFCTNRFAKAGIDLKLIGIPDHLTIECREVQISQVLLNLLNNAFDAVLENEEKWVRLEVKETAQNISLIVADSGFGISEPIRSKIMEPFFTTKPLNKGTGLGLSISKGIIESHGGSLKLNTDCPNTSFVITIPKRQSTATRKAA